METEPKGPDMSVARTLLPLAVLASALCGCEALLGGAPPAPAVEEPAADVQRKPRKPKVEEPPPTAKPVTALVGATVIDGTGADPITGAVVLIEKDRISAVGPAEQVQVPKDAFVADVKGKWIVPGLIDSHVHFFQSGGAYTRPDILDLTAVRPYAEELKQIDKGLEQTFRRTLAAGITAVVDVGGPFWNFEVRDRAQKAAYSPRVAVAGPLISTIARPQLDAGDPPIIQAETPDAARELVRKQLEQKPDLIKVWFIVTPDKGVAATVDMLRAVVDESHKAGVRVAVHATDLAAARATVAAGAEILVHSVDDAEIDKALIAEMKQRGTILSPTLAVYEGYSEVLGRDPQLTDLERRIGDPAVIGSFAEVAAASGNAPAQAEARRAKLEARAPVMSKNLKKLVEAGVIVAAGTDAGNIGTLHGPTFHREIELMAAAGLTPEQILIAATRDAAKLFAEKPEIGTLEPGKLADLLVLDADPLDDAANLQRIHRVVKGGAVMEPDKIQPPNPAWVVQQQVDAYNARDVERFVSYFAEDAEVARFPEGDEVATGRAKIREVYAVMFEQSPQLSCRIVSRTVQGRYVVDHELVTGIRGGNDVRAVAIYEVDLGQITRVWFLPKS
jgi:imidazolonepropionase-like amidohydrolase/predicted SnoaL-like aldol condensation-catalyzing enzyme